MKSSVETLEGNKVKLSIEVDEVEFDRDIDAAFRKIAKEVRLPGFRNGKAPRKVLETRIGLGPARQQALQDAIPQYLAQAVRQHDVDLIATPSVEVTAGEEDGPITFDAECEVRPVITVPGYGGLRVEVPAIEATDEEFDEALQAELRRHGSLVDVDRSTAKGDHVVIDLEAHRDGEPVAGLNVSDWSYEVGRGWVAEGFDDHLTGRTAGESFTFTATPSGTTEEADFSVTVTKVQEMQLPELTDEWVADNIGEPDTADAWKASLRSRLDANKSNQSRSVLGERATSALAELVEEDAPKALVDQDLQNRVQNFVRQLAQQGIPVDRWLELTGQDPASFTEGLRSQSERAVKVDLALRAIAQAEGISVSDAELNEQFERIAVQVRQKPAKVRAAYEKNDAVADMVSQMRSSKALEWLLHHVEIVDESGRTIDNDSLIGHSHHDHDHDGHDHDHDHEGHDHDHGDSED